MAEYRRAEIVTGLVVVLGFIVLSVVVFGLFALKATGRPIPLIEKAGVKCVTWFEDVHPLDKAAKVSVGGFRVGSVSGMEVDYRPFTEQELGAESRPKGWERGRERHLIKVTFTITDPEVRIGEDATVAVVQEGFIGSWYLAVDPGTWGEANKPPRAVDLAGTVLTIKATRVGTLQDLLPVGTRIFERIDAMLAKLQGQLLDPLLDGKEENIRKIIPDIQQSVTELREGIADARRLLNPDVEDSIARNANTLLKDADQSITVLRQKLTDEVIPTLKAALEDGKKAMATANATIEDLKKTLNAADPKVQKVLADLADESGRLKARIDELQGKLGKMLDSADNLVSLRQAEVAEVVRSLLNTAWEVEMAARKVRANPAVLIFGDDEKRLEADPRDDTGLRNRARVKPYEQRDESPTKKD